MYIMYNITKLLVTFIMKVYHRRNAHEKIYGKQRHRWKSRAVTYSSTTRIPGVFFCFANRVSGGYHDI